MKDTHKKEKFQNWISSFTVNSLFHTITEVTDVQGWINADVSGATTGSLNSLLPGIADHYGAEQPVDVFFHLDYIKDFTVKKGKQEMSARQGFTL